MCPRATSHSVNSLVTAPLTQSVSVLPTARISQVFHSPAGFTRFSAIFSRRLTRCNLPLTSVFPNRYPPAAPVCAWCQMTASAPVLT